jgi:hypothetical protein
VAEGSWLLSRTREWTLLIQSKSLMRSGLVESRAIVARRPKAAAIPSRDNSLEAYQKTAKVTDEYALPYLWELSRGCPTRCKCDQAAIPEKAASSGRLHLFRGPRSERKSSGLSIVKKSELEHLSIGLLQRPSSGPPFLSMVFCPGPDRDCRFLTSRPSSWLSCPSLP